MARFEDGRTRAFVRVEVDKVRPNPYQPRSHFSEASIAELAASIRQYGLLSPLVVRRVGASEYELVAGERRLRALKSLGLKLADALVLPALEKEAALMALIENVQREDLNCFEEAEAYRAILRDHALSQEALSRAVGKSPSCVANKLRLLKLSEPVRARVTECGLSERHARALLRLPDEPARLRAISAASGGMSVKRFEELIERWLKEPAPKPARVACRDPRMYVNALQNTVRAIQGTGAKLDARLVEREDCLEFVVTIPRAAHKAQRPLSAESSARFEAGLC